MTLRSIGVLATLSIFSGALTACGAGSLAPSVPSQPVQTATGSLALRIVVPRPMHRSARRRGAHYVSVSAKGITVAIAGPTNVRETASLQSSAHGCSSGSLGTTCTLTIPHLHPCAKDANCYTASIATYDAISGCPAACSVAGAKELSANQSVPFRILAGKPNSIHITLDGIPVALDIVPAAGSSLIGSAGSGYTLSKCGSDGVSVFGLDADNNDILGAGAPIPSLVSDDTSKLSVSTPPPANPNLFTIVRPSPPPNAHAVVHLTAGVTPLTGASPAPKVTTAPISMTFNGDICGVISQFTISDSPNFIADGPDGNIWYTIYSPAKVAKMTTSGTLVQEYPVSTITGLAPIINGPNNQLWFTALGTALVEGTAGIGNVTTSGTVTPYVLPTPLSNPTPAPTGITVGPDGDLWFVENNSNNIVRMSTSGTILDTYPIGGGTLPFRVVSGPDNRLWFTEGSQIAAITTDGATITQYTSGITGATEIIVGLDGALWFSDPNNDKIGRIDTSGNAAEYDVPTPSSFPVFIVDGPDGALWFTESSAKQIGRITTAGIVTKEIPIPTTHANDIGSMTLGPDGALWFIESISEKIVRLQ